MVGQGTLNPSMKVRFLLSQQSIFMYNHAPENYKCPLCLLVNGIENEHTMAKQGDIVYRNEFVVAMINSKFMAESPGHVIIMPVKHLENLYELESEYANRIIAVSQKLAIAMKEVRKCDGIIIKQLNEPTAGQHAFHYHMHIIPIFNNDNHDQKVIKESVWVADPSERLPYANALREYLESKSD